MLPGDRSRTWLVTTIAVALLAASCADGGGGPTPRAADQRPGPEPTSMRTPSEAAPGVPSPPPTAVPSPSPARQPAPSATSSPVPRPVPAAAPSPSPIPVPSPTPASVATPLPAATQGPEPLGPMAVERAFPSLPSVQRMVHLTYPDDGSNRLFLVLQAGRVMAFDNDRDASSLETFLDIRNRVNDRGEEEGLLGMAFDPAYSANGYFYLYYSAASPRRSVISRFSVSGQDPGRADPASEHIVLEVLQPYANHNGGHLAFGPDGYLYIGLGDGGARGDPDENGQDLSTLLGTILRIDVDAIGSGGSYGIPPSNPFVGRGGGAREEIWAYGLRNPWRFSFDRQGGALWAGDVGQNSFEEIDIIRPGLNYGWNVVEGFHCFREADCRKAGLELPVSEYGRGGGCSVTGGHVYRGSRLPSLYGAYVYADYCSGQIWALRHDGARVTEHMQIMDAPFTVPAFGEDSEGELYILSFDGAIYRLAER